jgi:hypothetical protein
MQVIEAEGIYAVISSSDLEKKTSEGWQLVGVLEDAEMIVQSCDTEYPNTGYVTSVASGTSYNMAPTPVSVLKGHVVKNPLFMIRRSGDNELGRMAIQLEEARKAAQAATAKAEAAAKTIQEAAGVEARLTREKEQAVVAATKRAEDAEAKSLATNKKFGEATVSLIDAHETIKKLEERLGRNSKPTAYERILDEGKESDEDVKSSL